MEATNIARSCLISLAGLRADKVFIISGKRNMNLNQLFNSFSVYMELYFSVNEFAVAVKQLNSKFLITIDDSKEIRELFSEFNLVPFESRYTSNFKTGEQLAITNYQVE